MSGKGMKANKAKKSGSKTKSSRAGLTLPVARLGRLLRKGRFAPRIGAAAPVFMEGDEEAQGFCVIQELHLEDLEAGSSSDAHLQAFYGDH